MKVTGSITTNIIWASSIAVLPTAFIGILLMLRFNRGDGFTEDLIDDLGVGVIFVVPVLLFVIFWILTFAFLTLKRPTFLEWICDDLVIGYRIGKSGRISLSDIEQVERINPTRHEQILKFDTNGIHDFSIALNEYEASRVVKKLKEDKIKVIEKVEKGSNAQDKD